MESRATLFVSSSQPSQGASVNGGHYTCVVRYNDEWYLYDDTSVRRMEGKECSVDRKWRPSSKLSLHAPRLSASASASASVSVFVSVSVSLSLSLSLHTHTQAIVSCLCNVCILPAQHLRLDTQVACKP